MTAKKDKASSVQTIATSRGAKPFSHRNALTLVSVSTVPKQDLKIATGLYLVRAGAASSVVVNNPGEPQVLTTI